MNAAPLFRDRFQNSTWESLEIDGRLPSDFRLSLIRVGVGTFSLFGERHKHWFDGDGCLVRLDIMDGKARGALSLLDCTPPVERSRKKKILGRFGVSPRALHRRLRSVFDANQFVNSANTAPLLLGNDLYALWEGGLPTAVDFETLSRRGQRNLGGIPRSFSAHPKWNPHRHEWLNFGTRFFPRPSIDCFRFTRSDDLVHFASVPYQGGAFVHDFGVTSRYAVFLSSPAFISPFDFVIRGRALGEDLRWLPKRGLEVILVPLDAPHTPRVFHAPAEFVTHVINAFDRGDDVLMDAISYPDTTDFKKIAQVLSGKIDCTASRGVPVRWKISPKREAIEREDLDANSAEVPTVFPDERCHETQRFSVAGYRDQHSERFELFDAVRVIRLDEAQAREIHFDGDVMGEAVWCRMPHGAALAVQCYSIQKDRSYVAILDGNTLDVFARVWFPDALPFTFHGLNAAGTP